MKHIRKIQIFHAITLLSSHVLRFFIVWSRGSGFPFITFQLKYFLKNKSDFLALLIFT